MKIDKSLFDDYAVLTLKGEFDTFYCPKLQEEIEGLLADGISHVVLNLRLVKFINSTALGAIIKAFKRCKAEGGQLVLSQPSQFAGDIIGKLGINKLVPMYDDDDAARRAVVSNLNQDALATGGTAGVEEGKVLITFPDEMRGKQAHPNQRRFVSQTLRTIVGTLLNVDPQRIQFGWNGAKNGLSSDQAAQLFVKDSDLNVKFQVKLFKKGFFELTAKVQDCAKIDDESVRITAALTDVPESDTEALQQFAEDMEFLKRQIPPK